MDTKALRQKILDLAIRGKLVPQDPNDEPASVLLERIRVQKQQMVKEGKLKAKDIKNDTVIFVGEDNLHYEKFQDGSVKCIEDEIPFEIPQGWEWTRLGNIAIIKGGKRIPKGMGFSDSKTGHIYIRVVDMKNNSVNLNNLKYISNEVFEHIQNYTVEKNDLYITIAGTIGEVGEIPEELDGMNLTENAAKITSIQIDKSFLCLLLQSDFAKKQFNNKTYQVAMPKLGLERIQSVLIPICGIKAQLKIIASVKQMLNNIESIHANKSDIIEDIRLIKSRILDLAIRGKLVPQDPNDEPASVLLERIRAEKEELIKQGKIKRDKKESVIFKGEDNSYYLCKNGKKLLASDVAGFELPNGWDWLTLNDICTVGSGKTPPLNLVSFTGTIPYFKISDMNILGNELYMTKAENYVNADYEGVIYKAGSFIFPKNGGAVLTNKKRILKTNSAVDLNTGVISPTQLIDNNFAFFLFLSVDMKKLYKGSTIPTIDLKTIGNLMFALPPLEEQKRIAREIEICFSVLDKISERLT